MENLKKFLGIPYSFWSPGFEQPVHNVKVMPSLECLENKELVALGKLVNDKYV